MGTREELDVFLGLLEHLKFTLYCHQQVIDLLDVSIFIDEDLSLGSTLFRKELSGNTLLHGTILQLTPLVHSIPYSQYLGSEGIVPDKRI